MKTYPNIVFKYASNKASANYGPIEAENEAEYNKKQLDDIERFLKEDCKVPVNKDNQLLYDNLVAEQREVLEGEIARLKGQLGL